MLMDVTPSVPEDLRPSGASPVLVGLSDRKARAAIARTIANHGHDVIAVADGYHLTQKLADTILGGETGRPGLIIVNPVLPGCTGVSLLAGLRDLGWDTPVVFVIDSHDERSRSEAWVDGVSGVFIEPVDLGELGAFVDLILEREFSGTLAALRATATGDPWMGDFAEGTNPGVD